MYFDYDFFNLNLNDFLSYIDLNIIMSNINDFSALKLAKTIFFQANRLVEGVSKFTCSNA